MESVLLLVFFYISVLASFSTVAYSRPEVGLLRVGCLIKDVEEATTSACEASLCSDMPFSLSCQMAVRSAAPSSVCHLLAYL